MATGKKELNIAVYTQQLAKLPMCALRFIKQDAQEAIDAMPDGPNAGYYVDEIMVVSSEIRQRAKKMVDRERDFQSLLSQMYFVLREAGYNSYDMLDDLKDLVNDSQRPATEMDKHGLWTKAEEAQFKQDLKESEDVMQVCEGCEQPNDECRCADDAEHDEHMANME